jgi:hypothetical protein
MRFPCTGGQKARRVTGACGAGGCTQHDGSVTIRGRPLLGEVYRSVLDHIAHRRANGAPSDDLRQAARLLYRAYMSPQRRPLPMGADTAAGWNSQDGELIGSAEAARLLAVSRRQAQRLAASSGADLATRCGPVWLYRRAAVQALAQQRKKAARHGCTTAARSDGLSQPMEASGRSTA